MNKKLEQMIKWLLWVICFLCLANYAVAKTKFAPFRADLGVGYVSMHQYKGYGLSYYIEPRYAVLPKLNLGIKAEMISIMFSAPQEVYKINSCFFTTDYYFTQNVLRSFIGAGIGVYNIYSNGYLLGRYASEYNLGYMFRAGFDVNHFRFKFGYDFVGKNLYGSTANVFSISIGAYLWGGMSDKKDLN